MKVLRYGFRLQWQEVPREMARFKIGEVDSFYSNNGHGGVCWGFPKECSLTNSQAKTIMWEIWKKRSLTYPQMKAVRKAFAYAYELTGGPIAGGNFPGVNSVWKMVREEELPESTTTTIPEFIPTPEELKVAFTKEWSPQHPLCLMRWLQGLIQAYDLFVFGLRSREDVDRIKKSTDHQFNWKNGWMCTSFVGGRAKLSGNKRNTRPWKVWRRCHCPGSQHIRPPSNFRTSIDKKGNPMVDIKWCTCCPLAAMELIWQFQTNPATEGPRRTYGRWLDSGRYGTSNTGPVAEMAIDWMVSQGACSEENQYDTNSGRKSLARWCQALHIPYRESFHLHGDLFEVWAMHYEQDVEKQFFKRRDQSTEPKVSCVALKKFANFLGRGKKVKVHLTQKKRYFHHLLAAMNPQLAEKIRLGLPSDDEESSDD